MSLEKSDCICLNEDFAPQSSKYAQNRRGLIGVIHVDTSTVYFSVYTTSDFKQLLLVKEELQLVMLKNGWFEEDAEEIMSAIYQCFSDMCGLLPSKGQHKDDIVCIAITNQRETTVIWDSQTGCPLYKAIVWNDIRTSQLADKIYSNLSDKDKCEMKKLSGLPLSPYFSALKIRWLMDNVPGVRKAIQGGFCKAGTLDSWIVWNLTRGKLHITDVTNASRTMLMNIQTMTWDPQLLKMFGIDGTILPQIRSCSEVYGRITATRAVLKETLICGIIGDQQAALVGQSCLERGQANCNYGMGCFLLCNTGLSRMESSSGLITTVAFKMGPNARAVYALEGSVAVGGHVFEWLVTKLQILPTTEEAEKFAQSVTSTGGMYIVPAFTGLYAPHWCKSSRGIILGLNRTHSAKHVVRAAHEAICYQVTDILECMYKESGMRPTTLHADGKFCGNQTLMQLQADISGLTVSMSLRQDRSSLGAALCAAHAYSFDLTAIKAESSTRKEFQPMKPKDAQEEEYEKWKCAIEQSKHWTKCKSDGGICWYYTIFGLIFVGFLVYLIYKFLNRNGLPICPNMRIRRKEF